MIRLRLLRLNYSTRWRIARLRWQVRQLSKRVDRIINQGRNTRI